MTSIGSSSTESLSDGESLISLKAELADWSVLNDITRKAANELLVILRKHGLDLPKDRRTLVNAEFPTPAARAAAKCSGDYVYFEIENGLKNLLEKQENPGDKIEININIDGFPIYKSTSSQFWPILCLAYGKIFTVLW